MKKSPLCIFRRLALGSVPILGLLLSSPVSRGNAQINVFTALLSTIGGMATSLTGMQQIQATKYQFEQTVLWPSEMVNQFHSRFSSMDSNTQGMFSLAHSFPINSATMPLSSTLESSILSGTTSPIGSAYSGLYGLDTPTTQALPVVLQPIYQSIDMNDAAAMDSMQESMSADATMSMIVNQAQQLQNAGNSSAPGIQGIYSAQAMANELQAVAQQHKLYAAMLRQEGTWLAVTGMQHKQDALSSQNTNQGVQNIVNPGATTP